MDDCVFFLLLSLFISAFTYAQIASILNGPEAFANFRRSGYPALAPNPYPGKEITGPFITRLSYPTPEVSVNTSNVQAAIARQGADNLQTRVWWDKP